jgi:hypothetical protein
MPDYFAGDIKMFSGSWFLLAMGIFDIIHFIYDSYFI